ncbi:GEVED domain-containing protein [Aquimarina sp. 2201CG5-10]|uniref:GEVED domain-containing protein n=1 Tax=Aquimarina callyspongiae TaxID=3098150 RepID=UPI002AB361F9|nr:GEVED domain-containing protein [Aquimarina sp. 2201CG5-10]MDY8137061.1 GEVED domain-containing protein [Aquimarina sp. 2201CG5-10]
MKTTKNLLILFIFFSSFQSLIAQESEYCEVFSPEENNYITNVTFANLKNPSELGNNGYSDFTDKKAYIQKGREYQLEVTTRWTHWSHISIQAWIDWNGDASFESSERVLYKIGTGSISGTVAVPENAQFGVTRMRIRYNYDAELGACEVNNRIGGEIEDYTIMISEINGPLSRFKASSNYINDDKDLVEFADASTNTPTSWHWEFEGGIPSVSTQQFPLVRYIRSGRFSVKLIVKNEFGEDEAYIEDFMTVNIPNEVTAPICNFSTVLTHVTDASQYVRFDDLSENNPTSWNWEFEGATPATSTMQTPQVKYDKSGSYSVKLTVRNSGGEDVMVRENYIVVDLEEERCTSTNERPVGQYITNVNFSNVNNASTYNSGYEYYSFPGTTVERGPIVYPNEASVIEVKTNAVWYQTKLGVWVDWNQDTIFSPGERHNLGTPSSSNGSWISFFVIPENAKLGKTILRVRTVYGEELSPCGNAWFGETEDYEITVVDPKNRNKALGTENSIVSPNPSNDGLFNFTFNQPIENVSFEVYNNKGIKVYTSSGHYNKANITLDLSKLNKGLYTVITTVDNKVETTRIAIH